MERSVNHRKLPPRKWKTITSGGRETCDSHVIVMRETCDRQYDGLVGVM